ncbi:hypothetical protein [Streptomyces sp. SD15]
MFQQYTPKSPVLEPPAAGFAKATAKPPYLFDVGSAAGRKAVDEVQSGDIAKPAVDEEWVIVDGGPRFGRVCARSTRLRGAPHQVMSALLSPHGPGMHAPLSP